MFTALPCIISLHCFNFCMAYFIRINAETEAAYELIAEPVQEPSAGEPQPGEVVDQAPEEVTNPTDLQGKPQSIISVFSIQSYYLNIVH